MRTRVLILLGFISMAGMSQEFDSFFEEFNVVLYQLQVNVLDKQGNPIKGLKAEDFQLKLEGTQQKIESIQEFELESVVHDSDMKASEIPQQARRLFVFFFDLRFSTKRGVLSAQEAARDFVTSEMLPTDLAGVFTYNPLRGVSMVTNFTNDSNHLMTALDNLGLENSKHVIQGPAGYYLSGILADGMSLNGFNANGQLTNAPGNNRQGTGDLGSLHIEEMMQKAQNSEKQNYDREVANFLASMTKFADGLQFIRGRKNMVWFSTGFDSTSLVGASNAVIQKNAERAMFGQLERIDPDQFGKGEIQSAAQKAVESLQASGTVVFALDTSMVEGAASSKHGLQTLNFFAADTGGRVFTNSNKFDEPLEEVKSITNHYYLVSFYPEADVKPGEVGRVKLKVNRPKAKIYTNRGLLLDPNFKGMTQIEKDIHISEYIARDQVVGGMPIEVGILQVPTNEGLVKLNVGVDFRGDYFTSPGMDEKPHDIEIFTIAYERNTNQVFDQSYFQFQIDASRTREVLSSTGIKYFSNVFVKPGDYKIKVVARDLENGKIGSFIDYVNVDRSNIELSGPIVLSNDKWLMVRPPESVEKELKAGNFDFSFPFEVGDKMLTPTYAATVARTKNAKFFYMLDYRQSDFDKQVPTIQLMFMDADNKYIMIPPEAIMAETDLKKNAPHLTNVVVTVDLTQVSLKEGETYKLMAYFGLKDQPALRSMTEVTIAAL